MESRKWKVRRRRSTFQAEVNLIEVDAIVTGDQGNTVAGLTADDAA